MIIFPAIDLYDGKAVRLYKGDYDQMTVYSNNPPEIAKDFKACGANHMHIVDLEGAKSGTTPNFETVLAIKEAFGGFCEIGGGIRSMDVVKRYLDGGIDRVILGTAAVKDRAFTEEAALKYGERIALGVDIKDGFVAVKGWIEKTIIDPFDFCREMQKLGISTLICTDISRDGAMKGTNVALYEALSRELKMNIIASGGVAGMEDVAELRKLDLYGAIVGKAYYTGALDLKKAVEVAK
jgi:phosphoribosylformimino-5-aminoimidazole carboxamide ribotide isomerase